MGSVVHIEGSYGEGGGQILRTALVLSSLTGRATRVRNIRAGRRNPGLAPQHLTGVLALAQISDAELRGAEIGSTEVDFVPRRNTPRGGRLDIDVTRVARGGSAGSVTLVLQTVLFPLAFAGSSVEVTARGGTHVAWSPPFDYFANVFVPTLARMGLDVSCRLDAWGFYPAGGGQISITIHGRPGSERRRLEPVTLTERGRCEGITGRAVVSNLPDTIARRMAARADRILNREGLSVDVSSLQVDGEGPGAGIFLTTRYEKTLAGFSALGSKGLSAEKVAEKACEELVLFDKSGQPVDRHLADQLILAMTLSHGRSEMQTECVTQHLLTNVHVIERFFPARIRIEGRENEPGLVSVDGIG